MQPSHTATPSSRAMSFSISLAIVIRPRPGALWLLLRPPESRSGPYRQDVRQGQIRTLAFVALHATPGPSPARGRAWDASRSGKTLAGQPISQTGVARLLADRNSGGQGKRG